MSEVNNGLRFDIYERVHLPDNVAAIEELEEIELVPRIQVIDQGDEAVLKGQLVLNGIYRGQGEEADQVGGDRRADVQPDELLPQLPHRRVELLRAAAGPEDLGGQGVEAGRESGLGDVVRAAWQDGVGPEAVFALAAVSEDIDGHSGRSAAARDYAAADGAG